MIVVAILAGVIGAILGVWGKDSATRGVGAVFSVAAVILALIAAMTGRGL